MSMYRVELKEINTYTVVVDAEDFEQARSLAYGKIDLQKPDHVNWDCVAINKMDNVYEEKTNEI